MKQNSHVLSPVGFQQTGDVILTENPTTSKGSCRSFFCLFISLELGEGKESGNADTNRYIYIYTYIPRTQMTLVLIGKGLVLEG